MTRKKKVKEVNDEVEEKAKKEENVETKEKRRMRKRALY